MINEALDIPRWRDALHREGRVQVADFLQADAAARLRQCLAEEVPWTLALRDAAAARTIDAATYAAMDDGDRLHLYVEAAVSAHGLQGDAAFRFAYDSYMMVPAYREGRDPGLLLHRVLELFNSPPYIAFARALSGDARIRRVNAQATRYRPGQFLRYHTDVDSSEGRLYAYVLNLSAHWQADWGGLLQFIDDGGRVTDTFLPRYNSLSLFAVPAGHAVSLVAPWAGEDRLAITGWWLS
ncbi:2OG-Fe(II) oxygenase [Marilutibacter chinensis]|uniref:2OG-Fe(II) oxygenase n=1 Tax=Marilutibacter chinensis TaxID=2912247 RepID=A0ABS9HWK9_9GAMM|nr:2OG-Fe(II) oxygenase family protein [Lysobacter chinensis]MCF7222911.1 2OG-Fe(II) oxygenase [Lysobacter chinensis]